MPEIINMPKLGFDMAEGTLVRWSKQEGDSIVKGEVLAEIETDKATVEVESNYEGVVYRHLVDENSIVPVGTAIAVIAAPGEKVDDSQLPVNERAESEVPSHNAQEMNSQVDEGKREQIPDSSEEAFIKASPLAKKMAQEHQLALQSISGTGPGGRVVKRDVEAAIDELSVPVTGAEDRAITRQGDMPVVMPYFAGQVPEDRKIPLNRLRGIIGQRMVQSRRSVPHFYVTHEVDAAPLLKLYKEINGYLPDDEKISINDYIVKATALSLRQFPNLNSSIGDDAILQHGHINVGVAVSIEGGLLTVVSKDTDIKPIRQISAEIKTMVERARLGKIKPDDIEGSTFSISNLGMFDVDDFVAIINPPEAAILAVGSARKVAVVEGDEIKPGHRMKLTLSADHRITDGAEAAQFLQHLARQLEEPPRLLL